MVQHDLTFPFDMLTNLVPWSCSRQRRFSGEQLVESVAIGGPSVAGPGRGRAGGRGAGDHTEAAREDVEVRQVHLTVVVEVALAERPIRLAEVGGQDVEVLQV